MTQEPLVLDRETWLVGLVPDLQPQAAHRLTEIDRDAIFEAIPELANREELELEVKTADGDEGFGAEAPLLIRGTRIFVKAGEAGRETLKRLVRIVVLYAVVGVLNPLAGFVGLTVDLVLDIFSRLSRLEPEEAAIVETLLELRAEDPERKISVKDLAAVLDDTADLETRVRSLERDGIVESQGQGLQVVF